MYFFILGANKDKQASFCLSLFDIFFFFLKKKKIDLFAFVLFSNGTLNIAHKQFAWNLKLDTNNLEKPKVVLLRSSKNNMQVVSSHDPILTNQKTILHHECNYMFVNSLPNNKF